MAPSALKVLYRLKSKGYLALLVGGAIRDLYRGKKPRDFDIATDASIEEIRAQFRNSKTIGKRFPIVHTYFGNEVVEISSLKGAEDLDKWELIHADASRRDFTVNAVYYDIVNFKVIDPLDALPDILEGRVVPIGEVTERFEEDPIRMLRALKLVAKQGFQLSREVEQTIREHQDWTTQLGAGRRYEELTRVFLDEDVANLLDLCHRHGLFERLWPQGLSLLKTKGIDYFVENQATIPIVFTRGSFAKQSHTHLWFRMYLDSPYFSPETSPVRNKSRFVAFLGPLGMPFQAPILDTLVWVGHLIGRTGVRPSGLSGETRDLLSYYAEHLAGDDQERIEKFIETLPPAKKGRRQRSRKAQTKNKVKAAPVIEETTAPKPKRRRRRRRRKAPPN